MKRNLSPFVLLTLLFFFLNGIILADDSVKPEIPKKDEGEKKDAEPKPIEMTAEGKVLQNGENFILKTPAREFIFLPSSNDKDSKINLKDWAGKSVIITGKGTITKIQNSDKQVEKRTFVSIDSIKIDETKKEADSKPAEKK